MTTHVLSWAIKRDYYTWGVNVKGTITHTLGQDLTITVSADNDDYWHTTLELAEKLQTAIRDAMTTAAYDATEVSSVIVSIDYSYTLPRLYIYSTGDKVSFKGLGTSYPQFDAIIGGDGTDDADWSNPRVSKSLPKGLLVPQYITQDTGDLPQIIGNVSNTLGGVHKAYRWGTRYTREVTYQWLTSTEYQRIVDMYDEYVDGLVLSESYLYSDTDYNYVLLKPTQAPYERPSVALERYHVSLTLGKIS